MMGNLLNKEGEMSMPRLGGMFELRGAVLTRMTKNFRVCPVVKITGNAGEIKLLSEFQKRFGGTVYNNPTTKVCLWELWGGEGLVKFCKITRHVRYKRTMLLILKSILQNPIIGQSREDAQRMLKERQESFL